MKTERRVKRSCSNCIHEWACQSWAHGGVLAEANADKCQIYETVRDSTAYFIGYREGLAAKREKEDCL